MIDDLDALLARLRPRPPARVPRAADHGSRGGARPAARAGGRRAPAHRAARPGSPGIFGSRLLLRQTSRDEHVLAGGDPRDVRPRPAARIGHLARRGRPGRAGGSTADRLAACGDHRARADARSSRPTTRCSPSSPPGPGCCVDRLHATGARVVELGGGSAPAPAGPAGDHRRRADRAHRRPRRLAGRLGAARRAHAATGRSCSSTARPPTTAPCSATARSRPPLGAAAGGVLARDRRAHRARASSPCRRRSRVNPKKSAPNR